MKITVARSDSAVKESPLLVLPLPEGGSLPEGAAAALDAALGGIVAALLARGDFRGKDGETALLYPSSKNGGPERVLVVGMGKADKVDAERIRRVAGAGAKQAATSRAASFTLLLPASSVDGKRAAQAAAEGAVLGSYTFTELKSKDDDAPETKAEAVTLLVDGDTAAAEAGARVGEVLARAEWLARDLGNRPGNVATPTYLAETAQRIAREGGLKCTILGPKEMEKEGMKAILAVAAGSAEEPRFIVLEHRGGGKEDKPVVLVGKGLTFDAGGISIKPAAGMEEMKFDMCGGAAVLGAMQAIAELHVPLNVVGIVPSSENLLGSKAMKPGDVIGTHLGKTVEVVNTDAEGRLILADALSYAHRYAPAAIVDAATLTGAVVIGLGHQATGAMANDEALLAEVRAAGDLAGQSCWPLPMYDEYREQIKSDYADIKNSGGRPAGTITAAWFLREFVGDFPWVHLDVAGTAWGDGKLPYQAKGSTGVPTRTFVEWVLARAG
ncbi:MAG TPA: leucyl aminopeptidase [Longimicrobiaceae bacterium]|nr:leucyl aminopeptidase [Longimicrobiaceae bacterium]